MRTHVPLRPSCAPGAAPQGDYAAVTPVYTYALDEDEGVPIESAFSAWRTLLRWLGPPGLLMAALALLTVEEPRQRGRAGRFRPLMTLSRDSVDEGDQAAPPGQPGAQAQEQPGAAAAAAAAGLAGSSGAAAAAAPHAAPGTLVSAPEQAAPSSIVESLGRLRGLVADPAFLALTLAAALNDVGSWALVSWQATFYQRVYELQPSTYAPLLAVVIPVGGIIGGVGAGGCTGAGWGDWWERCGCGGGGGGGVGTSWRHHLRHMRGRWTRALCKHMCKVPDSDAKRQRGGAALLQIQPLSLPPTVKSQACLATGSTASARGAG